MDLSAGYDFKGVLSLTLFDGPIGVNPVSETRINIPTDVFRTRMAKGWAATRDATYELGNLTHFTFGTSNAAPANGDTHLTSELFRKIISPGGIITSGTHALASINLAFTDMVTAKTTVVSAVNVAGLSTSITVTSSAGFRIGDYVEVNISVTSPTFAKFTTITNIAGNVMTVFPAIATPAAADFFMQIVREMGVIADSFYGVVQAAPAPTTTVTTLDNAASFGFCTTAMALNMSTGAQSFAPITSATSTVLTLTTAVPLPVTGDRFYGGILADHATGYTFRKTGAQTATATLDFAIS